jgi:AcrR family transcriptional regulator
MNATTKPLRADARRNREKIMKAAREVFAEQGVEAQMDDVAHKADVGVGTVYRHFPTKDALLYALSDEVFARIADHVRTLLDLEDPWEAFTRALWYGAEQTAGDRAFSEIMTTAPGAMRTCPGKEQLHVFTSELMSRCKAAGAIRDDAMMDDIGLLMCGVGSAVYMEHPCDESWRRHLGIMIDGLRANPANSPLHC